MTTRLNSRLLIAAALMAAVGVSACGKLGTLDRPGPMFQNHARSQARAEREAAARANGEKSSDSSATSQTNGDYSQASDGAKDPALTPMRSDPLPGVSQGPLAGRSGGVLPDPYASPNTAPR